MTIAWITGGGTGIGRALAKQLYQEGARIAISGRRKGVLDETVREISAAHGPGEIFGVSGDAAHASDVARIVSEIKKRFGPVDLLINNAGSNANTPFEDAAAEQYEKFFHNNCMSAILATEAVLSDMRKSNRGTIINISSIYGKCVSASSASYTVSKYALTGYTDVLRQALSGTGIFVIGVYPGFIRTAMTLPFVKPGSPRAKLGKSPEELAHAILKALRRKKSEVYYPWYVPWALRLYRWAPTLADRLSRGIKRD